MTPGKVKKAFDTCFDMIARTKRIDGPFFGRCDTAEFGKDLKAEDVKAHLQWMCVTGNALVDEAVSLDTCSQVAPPLEAVKLVGQSAKKMEKAMRWLGFVQGAMWLVCPMSIEMLKMINKSEEV